MLYKSYESQIKRILADVKQKEKEERKIIKIINHLLPVDLDTIRNVIVQNSIDTTDF
jgi:hypothetical protein